MKLLITILLILLSVFIVFVFAPSLCIYLSVFTRRKVTPFEQRDFSGSYYEPYLDRLSEANAFLKAQNPTRLSLTARDGVTLCADYYPIGSSKTAVMVHGFNANPYLNFPVQAKWLCEQGFNVVLILGRAHPGSGGKRPGLGLIEQYDLLEWLDFLEKKITKDSGKKQEILLYGLSMGASAVSYASDKIHSDSVRAMILDCGFFSPYRQLITDSKRMHLFWPLVVPFMRLFAKWNLHIDLKETAGSHLENTKIPAFFIHGTADETVPIGEGMKNFDACASEKEKIITENGPHTVCFLQDDRIRPALAAFINRHLHTNIS